MKRSEAITAARNINKFDFVKTQQSRLTNMVANRTAGRKSGVWAKPLTRSVLAIMVMVLAIANA